MILRGAICARYSIKRKSGRDILTTTATGVALSLEMDDQCLPLEGGPVHVSPSLGLQPVELLQVWLWSGFFP